MAEQYFRAKAYRRVTKTTPRPDAEAGPYREPAEAADWAEMWLESQGIPDESFVDLYFNGEPNIHTSIYLLMSDGEKTFGVLNSRHATWPIIYMEGDGSVLTPNHEPFGRDVDEWLPGDSDEDEIDEDADTLDLGNQDDGSRKNDFQDDEDEDSEDEEDDSEEDEDDTDSDSSSDQGDEKDSDEEEVPRMTIFGKFKGPRGWRKRAETDADQETNTFAVKFGVLDPDRFTTAQQERNSRVEIRFIERNSRRDAGELRIRIPEGVKIRDDGRWLVAEIPYTDEKD